MTSGKHHTPARLPGRPFPTRAGRWAHYLHPQRQYRLQHVGRWEGGLKGVERLGAAGGGGGDNAVGWLGHAVRVVRGVQLPPGIVRKAATRLMSQTIMCWQSCVHGCARYPTAGPPACPPSCRRPHDCAQRALHPHHPGGAAQPLLQVRLQTGGRGPAHALPMPYPALPCPFATQPVPQRHPAGPQDACHACCTCMCLCCPPPSPA